MTFNRYMFLRMIVEFVGVVCCAVQLFSGSTLVGLLITGVIALFWACGEIWVATILNGNPPDATSFPTSTRGRPRSSRSWLRSRCSWYWDSCSWRSP